MSRPPKRPPVAGPPQQQYPPTAYIHSYEASLTYPESGSQTGTGGLIKYAGEVQGGCEIWADRWVLLVFLKGWVVYFDIYCVQIDNGGTALYTINRLLIHLIFVGHGECISPSAALQLIIYFTDPLI